MWFDVYLTPKAMPYTKRELGKIGITSMDQLKQPAPTGFLCELTVVLRAGDDDVQRNEVRGLRVTGREAADPFAPKDGEAAV